MLELAEVPAYLLERRLLEPRDVVEGELRVTDNSRLNRVFVVTAQGRRTLVVKTGPRVWREAAVLDRLHHAPGLSAFLPPVVLADPALDLLVLESPPGARDLTRHHARGRFSSALACEAGRALAALHGIPPAVLDGMQRLADEGLPFRVHVPHLEAVHSMSAAAIELTRLIQGLDDLCAELDRLAESSPEGALVHGDIRWDNVMAIPRAGSREWTKLHVIDWEHCKAGDPADDVGAFLGEYLRTWAQSVPIWDPLHPGRPLVAADRPLRRMRPAVRAFWECYARNSAAPAHELGAVLRRAVDLAAVRLLTAALEEAQVLDGLRTRVLCLVSLSRNLLCRRGDAPSRLLGLAGDWEQM